jgi:hypothetical protein
MEREQKILESLCFESMSQRHSDIREAHKETLRWTFDRSDIRLLDWLESDDGIYWISGKVSVTRLSIRSFSNRMKGWQWQVSCNEVHLRS